MKTAYIRAYRMAMYAAPIALAILSGCADEASDDPAGSASAAVETGTADAKLTALKASVKGTDIKRLTEYGHGIALTDYPKGTSLKKILGDVTSTDEGDVSLSIFSKSTGAKAVDNFASALEEEAKQILENAEDGDREDKKAADALTKLATDARAYFDPTQFDSIVAREHGIEEDGDLESHTLIATKRDGSFLVLSYTNFPF
jgi:hypothetical protein